MASLAQYFNVELPNAPLGWLHCYASGTTTPKQAYQDEDGLVDHALPTAGVPASGIHLDALGRPPGGFFLGSGRYTLHLYSAAGVLVKSWDNVVSSDGFFLQAGAGAVERSAISKMRDLVSVKDFEAVGDGSTSDQVAIDAAVAAAFASGDRLYWPDGTYLTTASIPNFHAVKHWGPGIVKRGADLFYITPSESETNSLYVATTGVDTNDGLTSSQPMLTLQKAIDTLEGYGPILGGVWEINLAAGTYALGRFPDDGLLSREEIIVQGPDVGGNPNVPTVTITNGATASAVGLQWRNYTRVRVKNIHFLGYNGTTSSGGVRMDNFCRGYLENVHLSDCYYGVSALGTSVLDIKGGIIDDCGYLNSVTAGGAGIRGLFNTKFEIGTQSAGTLAGGPTITNCSTGILAQEGIKGHVDYTTIEDCSVGVRLFINSRLNMDGSSFKRNGSAVYQTDGSVASPSTATVFGTGADANTRNIVSGGSSVVSSATLLSGVLFANATDERCYSLNASTTTVQTTSATVLHTATLLAQMWRETPASSNPAKCLRFRLYGTLSGTADIKRIQMRFGATLVSITFTASETGDFQAEGVVFVGAVGSQHMRLSGSRNGGTGTRHSSGNATEALTANTDFTVEALVGNAADSVVVNALQTFVAGA